jgi:predicted esterase
MLRRVPFLPLLVLLPPLEKSKGHAYYLYHSPDDRVCPYRMVERAVKDLKKNGARVELKTYAGGHGWRGGLYDHIRQGIEWLDKNSSAAGKE